MTINTNTAGVGRSYRPGLGDSNARDVAPQTPPQSDQEIPEHSWVFFQEGRTAIILLLGFLYLLLAFSLDAAGWVNNMAILVPVTLGAVAMGTLMAFSRFDGFFMLSHSLSTGLAWVFFLMTRLVDREPRVAIFVEHGVPELQARSYFLLERWLEWVQAMMSGSASSDNYVFILEISFLIWWLAYLGAWTVFRHGYIWRGVILAGSAILVNTYYAPKPVIGLLVTFCITAIILLAWTNLVTHRQRWRQLRVRFNQDIGFDFMRNGILYAVIVISLAFIAPTLGRNFQFHQWLTPINQRWESASAEWSRLYEGINRQAMPVQASFGRSLTLGGERNVTPRPILQVSGSEGRYWRAVAYDTFTGRQWLNTATVEVQYGAGEMIPTLPWSERRPITHTVSLLAASGNVLFAAPDARQVSVPVEGLLSPVFADEADELASGAGELIWGRLQIPLQEGDSYTVVSYYSDITQRALRNSDTDYPPQIVERYLQLPDNFSPRVAALAAELTQNEETVYDKSKKIESFLREYEYSDQIAAPAADQDPVEYFLFDLQKGYCDYYATSMVVMLRSLGIPSRAASGYAEGEYDRESGSYIITEQDAHTWVEVYFSGYGWIEFEPTAGESVLNRPAGIEAENSSQDRSSAMNRSADDMPMFDDPMMDNPTMGMDEWDQGFAGEMLAETTPNQWLWATLLLTVAALIGGIWLLRRRLYQGPNDFEAAAPNLFYERLVHWANRLGSALRPDQTPYERASLLSREIPLGAPFIGRITEAYVRYRFAPRRSVESYQAVEGELAHDWQLLRPILWRLWLKRQLHRLQPWKRDIKIEE
jgi:transglutaminase-like putative cysteine protease